MYGSDRSGACLLAAAALRSADLAVLMPFRMLLAFFRANAARERAGLHHCVQHLPVRPGAAGSERSGRVANVTAIEIEADTLPKLRNVLFRDTGVSA